MDFTAADHHNVKCFELGSLVLAQRPGNRLTKCRVILVGPMKTSLAVITFLAILSATAHAGVGGTVKQVRLNTASQSESFTSTVVCRKLGYRYRGLMVIVGYVAGVREPRVF